jgi:hypothetical protein
MDKQHQTCQSGNTKKEEREKIGSAFRVGRKKKKNKMTTFFRKKREEADVRRRQKTEVGEVYTHETH